MQGNLLDLTEQRDSDCAPACVLESAPDCVADCAPGLWTELVQSLWEFIGDVLYSPIGAFVGFIVGTGTMVGWVRSAWRKLRRPRRPVRKGRDAGVWRVEPLLEPFGVDASAAVRAKGRVPLQYRSDGSRFSKFVNGIRRLVVRPSTPKPAFAALRAVRDPLVGRRRQVDGLPAHGFGVEIGLHSHESSTHFSRSLRTGGNGYQRTVAVCDAEQLERPGSLISCFIVRIGRDAVSITDRPEGDLVRLESVDPAFVSGKNEWLAPRSEIGSDVMWVVRVPRRKSPPQEPEIELEPANVRTARRKRLGGLVAFLVVMTLGVFAFVVAWAWIASLTSRIAASDLIGFPATPLAVFLTVFVFLEGAAFLLLGLTYVVHLLVSLWRECRSLKRWTAGTSACVNDADTIRNGHEFQCGDE